MKPGIKIFAAISLVAVMFPAVVSAVEPDEILMVQMSDGVQLSTAIYRPDPGIFTPPYPTILVRTPYPNILGQVDPAISDQIFSYMVDMFGLTLVIQDTRGTGLSDGEPDAFFSDWKDGPETVDWLLEQDWCDGQVMQFGLSALGIPGYLAGPNASDNMKCQYLGEAAPDMYRLAAFHGGILKKDTVEAWLSWVGGRDLLQGLSDHRNCDSFWNPLMIDRIEGDIQAAAMHIGGWYDVFTEGAIAGYRTYTDRGNEWAADRQYLIIGPWNHWELAGSLGETGGSGYRMQEGLIQWVAFCMAGDESQIADWPHVRYFVMGSSEPDAPGNVWRSADDWPIPSDDVVFGLNGDGTMVMAGDGPGSAHRPVRWSSSESEPGFELPLILPFDHTSVSPVVGGRNLIGSSGRQELTRVLARNDYVQFMTEPLAEPFESIGKMKVRLDVSTAWPDADIIVRLADVYPDGSAWLISDGAARISRREGCEGAVTVEPGKEYSIDVDLLSSAIIFNTGHRIALIMTTTMYPKYELNPELENESRLNGPIADALQIHGGELMLPVLSPVVEVPDTVESAEADVSEEVVIQDVVSDVGQPQEVVEVTDVAEVAADVVGDVAVSDAVADLFDTGTRPDVAVTDDGRRDMIGLDAAVSADVSGPSSGSGCSAGSTSGSSAGPLQVVLLVFAFAAAVFARRKHIGNRS